MKLRTLFSSTLWFSFSLWVLSTFSMALSASTSDNEREITLAQEAAPKHISENASYMIWNKTRFETITEGKNGFVCLVLRDSKGLFEPSCLNKAAAESILPVYEYRTLKLQQGQSIQKIYKNIERMHNQGQFVDPAPGSVVYMMSPRNKYYDHFKNKLMDVAPHIMLYLPKVDHRQIGLNGKNGLPGMYDDYPHLSVIHINTDSAIEHSKAAH